ncbi:WD40-repeat-containing domain protein [Hypoxylon trugodes]|uniref:WD40-repeat-containing domain protein n=1 Tax=Hypoxylon trugodes TaxID=326681 RepID=UPI00218D467B|nr:WD40-repeat-containing domain protein [Hypoxylon trugodes]KAI1391645.1 WD40-repeat-containing domain protein [Hypoxylon trugodes]
MNQDHADFIELLRPIIARRVQNIALAELNPNEVSGHAKKTGDDCPNDKSIATGAEDKILRAWDLENRTVQRTFTGHNGEICAIESARDGSLIGSCSDRMVRLWNAYDDRASTLNADNSIMSIPISPNINYVAAGSTGSLVYIWETHAGCLISRLRYKVCLLARLDSVEVSPVGGVFATAGGDKRARIWSYRLVV